VANKTLTPEVFPLTTKLLRLNPEYYTIWNVRRRLLISGLLSKRSDGSWLSKGLQTSSRTGTTTHSSEGSSLSSSNETQPGRESQIAGRSGTTAETDATSQGVHAPFEAIENDFAVIQSELNFIVPLLQEWPKCYWIWNYRGWILQQAMERLDMPRVRGLWEVELALDSKMLTKDRRNFHAWAYRRLIVEKLESPELDGMSTVEHEFEYTTKMIRADLSNFSAWHNRSKLIPRLLEERQADDMARQTFFEEGTFIKSCFLMHNAYIYCRDRPHP
jgi:geranylgeranyl transferase type-2 subunit alpha